MKALSKIETSSTKRPVFTYTGRWIYKVFKRFVSPYSYDVHGNVTSMLQDNHSLASIGQRFKRTDYGFDLISGKVNDMHYQNGQAKRRMTK